MVGVCRTQVVVGEGQRLEESVNDSSQLQFRLFDSICE
jgi:hypothetical protein